MFYSTQILARKGPLGVVWMAAHLERKLNKNQVYEASIPSTVDVLLSPDAPLALRLSGQLLLGVCRIYAKKVTYLLQVRAALPVAVVWGFGHHVRACACATHAAYQVCMYTYTCYVRALPPCRRVRDDALAPALKCALPCPQPGAGLCTACRLSWPQDCQDALVKIRLAFKAEDLQVGARHACTMREARAQHRAACFQLPAGVYVVTQLPCCPAMASTRQTMPTPGARLPSRLCFRHCHTAPAHDRGEGGVCCCPTHSIT